MYQTPPRFNRQPLQTMPSYLNMPPSNIYIPPKRQPCLPRYVAPPQLQQQQYVVAHTPQRVSRPQTPPRTFSVVRPGSFHQSVTQQSYVPPTHNIPFQNQPIPQQQPVIQQRSSNSIHQAPPQPQQSVIHQQSIMQHSHQSNGGYLPKNINHQTHTQHQLQQPPQPQQQHQTLQQNKIINTQSFIQKSNTTTTTHSNLSNQIMHAQAARRTSEYQQNKSIQQVQDRKDDELEKKFEEAIHRTKELVSRYQNSEKPRSSTPSHQPTQRPYNELALQYEDGFIYRGQGIEPSTREGYGVLSDPNDNEVYVGYWKDNQYDGHGRLVNVQATKMHGQFDYSDLNCIENSWVDYEGGFKDGKMHGRGTLTLSNGEKFEGQFNDGVIDGEGIFLTFDGQYVEGNWREGVLTQ